MSTATWRGDCKVHSYQIFGGATFIVPRGVRVRVKGFALFGTFRSEGIDDVVPLPDAPTITISGFNLFASTKAKRNQIFPPIRHVSGASVDSQRYR